MLDKFLALLSRGCEPCACCQLRLLVTAVLHQLRFHPEQWTIRDRDTKLREFAWRDNELLVVITLQDRSVQLIGPDKQHLLLPPGLLRFRLRRAVRRLEVSRFYKSVPHLIAARLGE